MVVDRSFCILNNIFHEKLFKDRIGDGMTDEEFIIHLYFVFWDELGDQLRASRRSIE